MPIMPMREDQLARARYRKGADQQESKRGVALPLPTVEPDPDWHPVARAVWDGALGSGIKDFYQAADLAVLWFLCEEIDQYKRPEGFYVDVHDREGNLALDEDGEPQKRFISPKRNAQILAGIEKIMRMLLLTEGSRRMVRVELHMPEAESDAKVMEMQRRQAQRARLKGEPTE